MYSIKVCNKSHCSLLETTLYLVYKRTLYTLHLKTNLHKNCVVPLFEFYETEEVLLQELSIFMGMEVVLITLLGNNIYIVNKVLNGKISVCIFNVNRYIYGIHVM